MPSSSGLQPDPDSSAGWCLHGFNLGTPVPWSNPLVRHHPGQLPPVQTIRRNTISTTAARQRSLDLPTLIAEMLRAREPAIPEALGLPLPPV